MYGAFPFARQDIGATPHASDLDESGKRFMKAIGNGDTSVWEVNRVFHGRRPAFLSSSSELELGFAQWLMLERTKRHLVCQMFVQRPRMSCFC